MNYLLNGRCPPNSHKNQLDLYIYKHGDTLNLGELEAAMIALNIVFQKIYLLPVSRWTGVKDKIVNVPILPETVNKNIQSLPRTPKDAQVMVPVKFKVRRDVE